MYSTNFQRFYIAAKRKEAICTYITKSFMCVQQCRCACTFTKIVYIKGVFLIGDIVYISTHTCGI